jgi:6-phosphogluconolactonase
MSQPFPATYVACALALLFLAPAAWFDAAAAPARDGQDGPLWLFVGTYTGKSSKGIYRFEMDPATGKLSKRALAAEVVNPSFLAIAPDHRHLYAVGEIDNFEGKKVGAISAFAIDAKTGDLTLLNQESSGGSGPCHLVVDKKGKHVLAANYGGGSACVVPIGDDGRVGKATAFVQHHGAGSNPQRQEAPHAHSINLDAANRFAVVADLGLDQLLVYHYDAAKGKLTPNDPPATTQPAGAGPRHFAFHPDGRHAYAINEMNMTVTALQYDGDHGILKPFQTISTLPGKTMEGYSTAEVQVHPSGKFLYGSNRGHNSIAVFRIEPGTGKLTEVGNQGKGIKTPRNFGIDPAGKFLVVANQDGDGLVVFRIDPKTGMLGETGIRAEVPSPVCVKMMARPSQGSAKTSQKD